MSSGSQSELPAGRAGDVFIIASLGPKVSGASTLYAINDERRKDFVETERGCSTSGYVIFPDIRISIHRRRPALSGHHVDKYFPENCEPGSWEPRVYIRRLLHGPVIIL